jgi:hypothetical protein
MRSVSGSAVVRTDPTYVEDFWNKPGYLGTENSKVGDIFRKEMLDYDTLITSIKYDANNVSTEVTLDEAPISTRTYWLDISIVSKDGEVLGKVTGKGHDNSTEKTVTLHPNNDLAVLPFLQKGTRVHISNRMFLAMHALHRYSIPKRSGFYGYDYLHNYNGAPIYPQRPVLVAEQIARSASGGATFSGRFNGKMIVTDNLMDVDAFPWQADWYKRQVTKVYGDETDNKFCFQYTENANHQMGPVLGAKSSRVVDFTGIYEQHMRDLSNWCETGISPSTPTNYTIHNAQVQLSATALERKDLQPVIDFPVNGSKRVEVKTGTTIIFRVHVEIPSGAGKVVFLEWDFEGTGNFVKRSFVEVARTVETTVYYTYSRKGIFFPSVRAASHREGRMDSPYGLSSNLGRMRVSVKLMCMAIF